MYQGFGEAPSFHHCSSSVTDFVMCKTMYKLEYGIGWQKHNCVIDMDFTDDIAILMEEED